MNSPIKNDIKRSKDTHRRYLEFLLSAKKEKFKVIHEYNHWILYQNEFPYDAVAAQHDLLFPKRDFKWRYDMNGMEKKEFYQLCEFFSDHDTYDTMMENFLKSRSIPERFHLHLIKWKKR